MSENNQPTLLVTGASGQLGRRVLDLLLESGSAKIIAATRTPEKLADYADRGVIVRHADFENPASLIEAFTGVNRLLLISTDTANLAGQRINQHRNAVKAAEGAGVSHVVYTSLVNPVDSPVLLARDHVSTEAALTASKMGWTVLRENIYTEMLLGSLIQALQFGGLFNAAANGKVAYITREDCARAAAAALSSTFEGRRIVDITGPEALSQTELAALGSEISGKELGYVPLELEALIGNMVGAGLPREIAEIYASFDTGIAQGKFSEVTTNFEELTGHKPTSISEFLSANRDALLQTTAAH